MSRQVIRLADFKLGKQRNPSAEEFRGFNIKEGVDAKCLSDTNSIGRMI